MKSEVVAVDVILQLGSTASSASIKRAFGFYSATYLDKIDPSISFEIKCKSIQEEGQIRLTFLGTGTALKDIAEGVHRFIESFLEEFYDESVEDDWLCELGCEELPIIVDYEVESARVYCEDE